MNNINVDETNRKISEYLKKNRQQIALGKIRNAASALEDKKNSSNLIVEDGISSTSEKNQVEVSKSQQKSNNQQNIAVGSQQVLSKFLYFASQNTENMSEEEKSQFLQIQKKAAGFDSTSTILRSYEEAFSTLYPTTVVKR